MPALARPTVCLVTSAERLAGPHAHPGDALERLLAQVADAARGDVDLLQFREPQLDTVWLVRLVERAIAIARGTNLRILVNDRFDVARAAGAHGVHLRSDSCPPARVRAVAPAGFLIGRSVHDSAEATAVARDGVDYLMFGSVFRSASKPASHAPAGPAALAQVVRAAPGVPVIAIGGVSVATAAAVAEAGASGVAAIGLFLPAPAASGGTIGRTVTQLRHVFDSARERR